MELLAEKDDYLKALRLFLRDLIRTVLRTEIQFPVPCFCETLTSEAAAVHSFSARDELRVCKSHNYCTSSLFTADFSGKDAVFSDRSDVSVRVSGNHAKHEGSCSGAQRSVLLPINSL